MKPFQVIFASPWPIIQGEQHGSAIVLATSISRALEVAEKHGPVVQITGNPVIPVIDDPRSGVQQNGV